MSAAARCIPTCLCKRACPERAVHRPYGWLTKPGQRMLTMRGQPSTIAPSAHPHPRLNCGHNQSSTCWAARHTAARARHPSPAGRASRCTRAASAASLSGCASSQQPNSSLCHRWIRLLTTRWRPRESGAEATPVRCRANVQTELLHSRRQSSITCCHLLILATSALSLACAEAAPDSDGTSSAHSLCSCRAFTCHILSRL